MNNEDFKKINEILENWKSKENIDKDLLANTCFADNSDMWLLGILFLCLFAKPKNEEPSVNIYIGSEE